MLQAGRLDSEKPNQLVEDERPKKRGRAWKTSRPQVCLLDLRQIAAVGALLTNGCILNFVCACQQSQVHDTRVFCPHLSQAHVAFLIGRPTAEVAQVDCFLLLRSKPIQCARAFFVRDKLTTFYQSAKSMETFGNLSLQELRRKRPLLQRAFLAKPQPKILFTGGFWLLDCVCNH